MLGVNIYTLFNFTLYSHSYITRDMYTKTYVYMT